MTCTADSLSSRVGGAAGSPAVAGCEPASAMPSARELARDFIVDLPACPEALRVGADPVPGAPAPCVIAIGAFDGVHRGHLDLLQRAKRDARERGLAVVAVTFDPDPDEVVSAHPAPKLTSMADRVRALASAGAGVAIVPFTRELAALDHIGFFERVLAPYLEVRAVHVGADFRLGAHGASTVDVMRAWGAARGMDVMGHELLSDGDAPITATRIRSLIAAGDVCAARRELGRRPFVRGVVKRGRGQGTGMGFPTANIEVPGGMQMPADGVYAGFALVDGAVWPAAINAGVPPMFADSAASARLEANLIGYRGDLYGKTVAVAFDRLVRPSRSFDSVEELIAAVNRDIATIKKAYGDASVRIA